MDDGDKPEASETEETDPVSETDQASEKPLKLQITELVEDVRVLAIAEVEYYRTKLSVNMAATKKVLVLFAFAVTFGLTAAVTLVLGILLIVSDYLGPIAATGLVTGTVLLVTAILMTMAIKRARKLPLDENDE